MKVLNIFGGPGSGKSVLRASFYSYLKREGYSIEECLEFAKELTLKNDIRTLKENQILVLGTQLQKLKDIEQSGFDYAITDSPLILSSIYNKKFKQLDPLILETFNYFENFNIFLKRDNSSFQEKGRYQSISEAEKLDLEIKNFLEIHKIPFTTVNRSLSSKSLLKLLIDQGF